jgi:hypothetical protein
MLHGDAVARAASPAATSAVVVHERTDIQPEAQPKAQRDNTEGPTGQEGEVLTPAVVQDKRLEVSDKLSDRTVSRSDVLPLLLALEEEDPSLGLGRLVRLLLAFGPQMKLQYQLIHSLNGMHSLNSNPVPF